MIERFLRGWGPATKIDGIEVLGCARFKDRTGRALEVLRGSPTFQEVAPFLAAIRQAWRSGLIVTLGRATFHVGRPTWQAELYWYASCIVHDAGHAKLYFENRRRLFRFLEYVPLNTWTGKEAERSCLRLQLAALRELGAPRWLERYVESLAIDPTYHRKWWRSW